MINIPREMLALKRGDMSVNEVAENLLKNYSAYEIAKALVELMQSQEGYSSPIVVSEEELKKITSLFKVRGIRADGTPEGRGTYIRKIKREE